VILAVVALAAALTATDPATDMKFTLSGRSLTVKIGPDTPAKVKARLNPTACGVERPNGEDISYGGFG